MAQRAADANSLRARVYEATHDYARADAIFGELMDATLHDSFEDAMNAVRQGVQADAGRVMALPGEAADQLIRSLLDSVDSVDDEAAAVESASRGRTAATPDGIMVRSDGIVQGGGSIPGAARLRRQMTELRSEREDLEAQLTIIRSDVALAGRITAAERSVEQAETRQNATGALASTAARRLESLRGHRTIAIGDRAMASKHADVLRERLVRARTSESDAVASLAALRSTDDPDLVVLEQRRDECAAVLAESRAQEAAAERARADLARLASLRLECEQIESAIREREPMLEHVASVTSNTASLDLDREHLEVCEGRCRDVNRALDDAQQARIAAEREAVESSAALREIESARSRLAADAAAEGMALIAPPDQSQSGFAINSSAPAVNQTAVACQQPDSLSAVTVAEPEAQNVNALRERTLALKARLQRLGPIDPAAAGEYDAERRRWTHMEDQIRDLEQTEISLHKAERDLERQIERQFRAACRQVDQAFQRYFRLMFRGGRAELILTDEDSMPEGGRKRVDSSAGGCRYPRPATRQARRSDCSPAASVP